MTKEELRKNWMEKVDEFKASGMTKSAWCKEKNINLRTFNYWANKHYLRNEVEENSVNWLSLKLNNSNRENKSVINIKIGNTIIETKADFDQEHLLKLINTLENYAK